MVELVSTKESAAMLLKTPLIDPPTSWITVVSVLGAGAKPSVLWRNDGNGTFTNWTEQTGLGGELHDTIVIQRGALRRHHHDARRADGHSSFKEADSLSSSAAPSAAFFTRSKMSAVTRGSGWRTT